MSNIIIKTFYMILSIYVFLPTNCWSELSLVKREDIESKLGTLPTLDSSASSGKTAKK